MSKTNKELAVDVALKIIEAQLISFYDPNRPSDSKKKYEATPLINITCKIIKDVYKTLEELDGNSNKEIDIDIEALDIP
ncbi:MAG: hypothetical protein Q7K47_00865 [Fusobacterium sp. JB019]|nr:hypothetical protein [Fusobacterium sp. JB019]